MKKVVNSVLASALAFTVAPMVVGAAEETAPKMDASLEKVVKRLGALGIAQGRSNGDYAVDAPITRAEFATLIVRIRGLEQGVKASLYKGIFTDVKSDNWFAGYVNIASGESIIKGYPDQTFRPSSQVTYAEAVAMVIRALGYEPTVKQGPGAWPNNFISRASELGVFKGVSNPNAAAVRGDVFKMLDNALNIDLMKQVEYGTDTRFEVKKDANFLTEYLDVKVYDMEWASKNDNSSEDLPMVSNVPVADLGNLKVDEIEFTSQNRASLKGKFKMAAGIDPNQFAGEQVQVWVKDGREDVVVWIEGSEDQEVVKDKTDTFYLNKKVIATLDKGADIAKLEIELESGKKYDFHKNARVTYNYNNDISTIEALQEAVKNTDGYGALNLKAVLNDDGDIVYMSVVDALSPNMKDGFKFGSEVIEKIDVDKKRIENIDGANTIDLKDKEEGKDFVVFLNGAPAKLADLKAMDVYSVYYSKGNKDKKIIAVVRDMKEGKVDSVIVNSSTDNRLKIGDKTYRINKATYSENGNSDVADITTDEARDLKDTEVKVYLDAAGRIRHIETKANIDDRTVNAVVTKEVYHDLGKDEYNFTVYTEKGTKLNISIDEIQDTKGDDMTNAAIKSTLVPSDDRPVLVEVELDDKGEVDSVQLIDSSKFGKISGDAFDKAADEDDNIFRVGGKSYKATDKTVVFDMTGDFDTSGARKELEDVAIAKFKSVADDDDKTVYYHVDGNELEYLFVVDGESVEASGDYGVVTRFEKKGGDDFVHVVKKDGTEAVIKLDDEVKDAEAKFGRRDFIRYTLNSSDEVIIDDVVIIVDGSGTPSDVRAKNVLDAAELDSIYAVKVTDIDGNTIEFGTNMSEELSSSALIYDAVDLEKRSDLDEGDYAVLVDTDDDGSSIDYVIFVADEDTVEENDYDMSKFLTVADGGTGPVDPVSAFENLVGSKKPFIGTAVIYSVSGKVKGATSGTVQITVGTQVVTATIGADGTFNKAVTEKDGFTQATVKYGDKTTKVDIKS